MFPFDTGYHSGLLGAKLTSESSGSVTKLAGAEVPFQCRTSELPGKRGLPSSLRRSSTVAGRSRRLTGSRTLVPAGTREGKEISSGTCNDGR